MGVHTYCYLLAVFCCILQVVVHHVENIFINCVPFDIFATRVETHWQLGSPMCRLGVESHLMPLGDTWPPPHNNGLSLLLFEGKSLSHGWRLGALPTSWRWVMMQERSWVKAAGSCIGRSLFISLNLLFQALTRHLPRPATSRRFVRSYPSRVVAPNSGPSSPTADDEVNGALWWHVSVRERQRFGPWRDPSLSWPVIIFCSSLCEMSPPTCKQCGLYFLLTAK
jgi:hypothetical protein